MSRKLGRNHNREQENEIFLHFILCAIEPLPAGLFARNVRCTSWAGLAQLVEHLICNKFIYFHKVHFYQYYQRTIKTLLIHNTFT